MSGEWYCPREECRWEGLEMPPGQACPRCSFAVEACTPDGNPRDQPASTNIVMDREAWAPYTKPRAGSAASEHRRQLTAQYEAFALRLARVVTEKQIAYGDSFRHTRKVLAILFPNGVSVEQYGDLLTITRIIDKLFRVANQKHYGGEDPYEDIAGYATRAACEDEQEVVASTTEDQDPIEV